MKTFYVIYFSGRPYMEGNSEPMAIFEDEAVVKMECARLNREDPEVRPDVDEWVYVKLKLNNPVIL